MVARAGLLWYRLNSLKPLTAFKRYRSLCLSNLIPSTVPDETIHMTVSIGIAQYRPGEDIKGLINRVDQCMYQAKKDGKNRFFSES